MGDNGEVSDATRCLFSGHQSKPGCQLLEEPLQSHPVLHLICRSSTGLGYEPHFLFTQPAWITTYPRSTLPINSPCTRCRNISHRTQVTSPCWLCRESKHPTFKTVCGLMGVGNESPVEDRSQMPYTDLRPRQGSES